MRIIFLSVLVFCLQLLSRAQNNIDVLHYRYEIRLNDNNDTVYGLAKIKVKFLQSSGELNLDLTKAKNDGKGMSIGKIQGDNIVDCVHKEETLRIILSKKMNAGDTATIVIPYSGIPSDGLIISKTKYGHRSFFADNWPDRGHNWIPCNDDPADKATVEFIVTAPEHYQVVANGVQIEETSLGNNFKLTHWREDTPVSTKVMVIGVADFAVQLAGVVNGKIPVYSWVYPENKDKGFYDYEMAKDILPFFINNVGPYGYKKLANVQSKTRFGGLENANTIFYSENSVSGTRKSEGLLAHEIAHQWFGNMATEKSFGHLWLSEGFATYFTILYFENKYGKDTAIKMLKEDRERIIAYSKESTRAIVDTTETDFMKLLNANSYQKGGWILHMLRNQLGDSVFWRSIRKYYATYAGGVAGTRDLQQIFESVSGTSLKQFFDQWLYTSGQPELDITWRYNAAEKVLYIEGKQLQKNIFHFPLLLKISSASGSGNEKLNVNSAIFSFKIKSDQKPASVTVDPRTELLARTTIKEK
ncbi:MAG TPA: M1 family metallopeptidase [Chitinophagaceae bacterium]|nr:M1 family metallopeptidase [Chitinophagaceae bacterium]